MPRRQSVLHGCPEKAEGNHKAIYRQKNPEVGRARPASTGARGCQRSLQHVGRGNEGRQWCIRRGSAMSRKEAGRLDAACTETAASAFKAPNCGGCCVFCWGKGGCSERSDVTVAQQATAAYCFIDRRLTVAWQPQLPPLLLPLPLPALRPLRYRCVARHYQELQRRTAAQEGAATHTTGPERNHSSQPALLGDKQPAVGQLSFRCATQPATHTRNATAAPFSKKTCRLHLCMCCVQPQISPPRSVCCKSLCGTEGGTATTQAGTA